MRKSGVKRAATSWLQDQAWFLQKLVPDSPAYTMFRAYRTTGELDVAALRAAWQGVVLRHEILRTTLVESDGLPVQEIAAGCHPHAFTEIDATGRSAEDLCADLARTPLDLEEGPLARLTVARLGPGDHLLVLRLHEAVADEYSIPTVLDELSDRYAAQETPPPAGIQYADYARWQRDHAHTPELHRLLDWWTKTLTPPPPSSAPPADRPRPAGPSYHGRAVPFDWPQALGRALAELAREEGITRATVLLAGFLCLLRRHTGEDRVAVGAAVNVRPGVRIGALVGPYRNHLVLSTDLSGKITFRQAVRRVARTLKEAYQHRGLPFDRLVQALRLERDPRRVPLCDVMFDYHDETEPVPLLGEAEVRPVRPRACAARTDLVLAVEQAGGALAGSLTYREGLYDEHSAELLLDQLHTFLAIALHAPDLPADQIPLEDYSRTRARVREADQTGLLDPLLPSAPELVHAWAGRTPDALALDEQGGDRLTYRELNGRTAAVTAALRALGPVEGASVVVRMAPGAAQVVAAIGVLGSGAQLTCLGSGDVGERGKVVLAELRPAALLVHGPGDELSRWYEEELGGTVIDVAALDAPFPPAAASADPASADPASADPASADPASGPGVAAPVSPTTTAPAYIAYTSGSTGKPKGIVQSHGSLAQFATWMSGEFRMRPGARVAQWAAPGYDAALCETFAALVGGATLCPVPERIRANPDKLLRWLEDERITVLQTVPSFAAKLLDVIKSEDAARRLALTCLLLAGEPLPGELANDLRATLPAVRLANLYGATETILATWHDVTAPVHGMTPIGAAIPGRQVVVLDDWDRPCPPGVTGHIVVRSPYVALGYTGGEDTRVFEPVYHLQACGSGYGRFYRTGDLGRLRWDGLLEFRGRGDAQIKFHGTRVELAEVEAALSRHESVAECALVPVSGPDGWVTRLVAYVVPRRTPAGEAEVRAADLRATVRARFGKSTLPLSVRTVGELPRNVGGKIDRRALSALASEGPRAAPRTPVEAEVAAIWAEILGAEPDGDGDPFFAAGGHSLMVPRLLDRVRERFGVEVPLWEFFANPTLGGLAAQVRAHALSTDAVNQSMAGE
ncbi:non-ribosomal peptide synthetase [Nonomuraea candida]|uniref:non-ribosomal peptide synthetase n=1 Tax=Nonomuraea candida TaxID=359159 RepID=UPI000A5DB5BF|nr:condensation domain-containing protein [Nonomuraea candida]